jgi:hypothetical protein
MVSLSSSIFPPVFIVILKLTGEFTSLEEPTDDPLIAIVLVSLADGSSFAGSKSRVEPEDPTRKFVLPIVKSISWFSSTSGLRLAKRKKGVEFMIPTPLFPMVGAN